MCEKIQMYILCFSLLIPEDPHIVDENWEDFEQIECQAVVVPVLVTMVSKRSSETIHTCTPGPSCSKHR